MLGLEGYDTSSEESENERMTPNMCETQAAKRTKMPVVNAFTSMMGRLTQTYRTSSTSTTIPIAAPEGAAPEGVPQPISRKERCRPWLQLSERELLDGLLPAFKYLENRLTGNCQAQFDCTHSYDICRVLRLFDPSYVSENEASIDSAAVRELALVVPLAAERGGALLTELERDLPLFIAAARGFHTNHGSVNDFTEAVLGWYKNHSAEIGTWAEASLIAFSFTPSSAAAERVFSLLKNLFGSNQDLALADYVQGSMLLRYNGTKRGTSF